MRRRKIVPVAPAVIAPPVEDQCEHNDGDQPQYPQPVGTATWQRLSLSLLGIGIITWLWHHAVLHLYTLPGSSVAGFTTITTHAFYAVAVIIVFMITGRLVWEWAASSSSIVNVASQAAASATKIADKALNKVPDKTK